jgi:hypothetical protein
MATSLNQLSSRFRSIDTALCVGVKFNANNLLEEYVLVQVQSIQVKSACLYGSSFLYSGMLRSHRLAQENIEQ